MTTKALSIRTWDDIVFENRHKDYGAYAIRQTYNRNIAVSIIIVSTVTLLACITLRSWLWPITPPADPIIAHPIYNKPYSHPVIPQRIGNPPPINSHLTPRVKRNEVHHTLALGGAQNTSKRIGNIPEPESLPEIVNTEVLNIFATLPVITIGCDLLRPVYDTLVTHAAVMPSFKGGSEAMEKFLIENIKYPLSARRDRIEGSVFVSFVVNTSGKVADTRIIQGIDATCDKEAARVIASMPDWNTGLQDGTPVPVRFVLLVKFKIATDE